MSSSGWGGPDSGPQPWQNGAPQGGQPQNPNGQGGGPQSAPGYGAPQASPAPHGQQGWGGAPSGPTGPQGASWTPAPSGPGSPQGPGNQQGPGGWGPGGPQDPGGRGPGGPLGSGQQPQPRPKRPWLLIGVALSCVLALLLVVGGGITYLALRTNDAPVASDTPSETTTPEDSETPSATDSTTPEESEAGEFEVVVPYDPPTGTPDELWKTMGDNPLTSGTLPTLPECDLPATPVEPSVEELQAVLDASATCLDQVWSTASSDRNLPWVSPKIVVYKHPDVPSTAVCDSEFSADFPRMCNLDSTIYWPVGYGSGLTLDDPENVPGAYLWDLSFIYTNTLSWNSSLTVYFTTLRDGLKTTDEERYNEAWRRFTMQRECFASAASMQVPTAAEPTPALREALTDPTFWPDGEPPNTIRPETRAAWIKRGFDSGGDLSVCNAWTADVDQVT